MPACASLSGPPRHPVFRHLAAFALYVVAALAFTWPLAGRLGTHLPGDPTGDTGVYAWNLWVFAREWRSATGPFVTDAIFGLTGGTDLALHNYTVASNLLALPLIGWLGPVATFNVVLLAQVVLAAFGVFVLARHVTGDGRAAWVAGLAFACSPVITARSMAHHSLVAAAPLPFFAWTVLRALEGPRWPLWALASGACLAWAGYSDVYYAIYCLVLLAVILAHRGLLVAAPGRWSPAAVVLLAVAAVAALAGTMILATGGGDFPVAGRVVHARTPFTAMAVAMGCLLLAGAIRVLPRLRWNPHVSPRRVVGIVSLCAGASAAALSPLLLVMARRVLEGRWVEARIFWRSSPAGLDALALVLPNPTHALWGDLVRPLLWTWRPDAFPEHVGSLSLVTLALVAGLRVGHGGWWQGARLWVALGLAATLLALGPFLTIAGTTTGIPGPWSLLRYVPVLGWARSPSRFAVLATLALCVLLAFALRELLARRRGPWLAAAATLLLAAELSPAPRTLYAAAPPSVYEVITDDPDPRVRVLELPAGVRDGTGGIGNFRTRTQFHQVTHGKAIVGGYLSRVSEQRRRKTMRVPTMRAIVKLSAGEPLTATEDADGRLFARRFVVRARIGYVVVIEGRASEELERWAIDALELRLVAEGGGRRLYRPAAWPPPDPLTNAALRPAP